MDADRTLQPRPVAEDAGDQSAPDPTWRRELPRWLASLNPGRTPHEYEKAVRYFFETLGIPDTLRDVTYDLLLAYRGALALRALPHHQRPARPRTSRADVPVIMGARHAQALAARLEEVSGEGNGVEAQEDGDEPARPSTPEPDPNGPLAPATVNIRLTALRQFLCFCSLGGTLPQLSPDRVRGALRRLSVERRRPYQVLAEAEWDGFLAAALAPGGASSPAHGPPPAEPQSRGPWGMTRAERAALIHTSSVAEPPRDGAGTPVREGPHQRLTGKRTARRDYALIALALATGLRAIELISLDVGDLRRERHAGQDEWWLELPDEKTKGQRGGRTLPLAPPLVETILTYIQETGRRWEEPRDRATPLFLSTQTAMTRAGVGEPAAKSERGKQRRLSSSHVRLIVDRVERQWREALEDGDGTLAGEGRAISPHALRHSTAVALLEGNEAQGRPPASVEHVRGWLGHFDIRTTQGYLAHLDARRHRRPFMLTPTVAPATAVNPNANDAHSSQGAESDE